MSRVIEHAVLKADEANLAWDFYSEVFEGINRKAAQRHLMTYDEFMAMCYDMRVTKYFVYDGRRIAGMSVMTDNLLAWPLVSPEYFEDQYPGRRVFYIGFVGVARGQQGVFQELISYMTPSVVDSDGVAVMDFCLFNVNVLKLPKRTQTLLASINSSAAGVRLDAQEFWAWEFPGAGYAW